MPLAAFTDPDQEASFRSWYAGHAAAQGLPSEPDATPEYDFRNAFLEGYEPAADGSWDYRASTSFVRTAGTKAPVREPFRPAGTTTTPAATPPALTDVQRKDALARLDKLDSTISLYKEALDGYAKGWVSPSEMDSYRALAKTPDEYARQVANHSRAFGRGLATGERENQAFFDNGFLNAISRGTQRGLVDTALGGARALGELSGLYTGIPGQRAAATAAVADLRDKIETEFFGLPSNPIERAGYQATFPVVGTLIGDLAAWSAAFIAPELAIGQAGMLARGVLAPQAAEGGFARLMSARRLTPALATLNAAGAVGGGLIAAASTDDPDMLKVVEGAMIGLGGTAFASSLLAGRPVGNASRLLRLQEMAETLGAERLGGALRVAPSVSLGRMARAGVEGASYTTLSAMGQGKPVDESIGMGVESGLAFAGYDVGFAAVGRTARWLPIHARIAETWAQTAEALKIPSRMASMTGDAANAALQGGPMAAIGGLIGGPVGAAIGGAVSAARATKLQRELATTAARLRSTGVIGEETVAKLLTGAWHKLSAAEAETVTKALTKDVVERATADVTDPVIKATITEAMGGDAILDNTELRALSFERGRVTQQLTAMKAAGIVEIDPQMVQASRRLAEIAERRSQILIEEANSHPTAGSMGAVLEKVVDAQMREIVETAGDNPGFAVRATVPGKGRKAAPTIIKSTIPRLDPNAGSAMERMYASIRVASGERAIAGATEGPPTRVLFRSNSTLLRDLADAGMERAGIDARISTEGEKAIDSILAPPRRALAAGARAIAPAGTRQLKAPVFSGESGRLSTSLAVPLGAGAVGAVAGVGADRQHPLRGALIGGAGASAVAAGLMHLHGQRRALEETVRGIRSDVERGIADRHAASPVMRERRATPRLSSIELSAATPAEQALELAYRRARSERTRLDPALVTEVQRLAQSGAPREEIERAIVDAGGKPHDYGPLYERGTIASPRTSATQRTIAEGYTFTFAGEQPRAGKEPIRYFVSNKDLPGGVGRAGARTPEHIIRAAGFDPFAGGESGAARIELLGAGAAGAVGAVIAPAIARRLGLLDEEDTSLTASAVGFLAAATLGYKALERMGARISPEAARVAKFVKPAVAESAAIDASRFIGKPDAQFRTTVNGTQVSGRRLYWAMPHEAQVSHTIATMDAWPQRTTVAGKPVTLPERRKLFQRDLARFAPFSVTDADWTRITASFQASTKALGYTPAESMRLYKGWLGWMTTPLEQRARVNIAQMRFDVLGRDATNPFSSAAGLTELRDRAINADTITGAAMPLPSNYRVATNSLNKDGTPAASRIRALVDDIEGNTPTLAEGTSDTLIPWWSAPGARGIAPTVRFYRYADRLTANGDATGQIIHDVTGGIFQATELARVASDKDRETLSAIFRGVTTPVEMDLLDRAVQSPAVREAIRATNPRVYEATLGVRKFLKDKADALGLQEQERIVDYLPWVYNYRTKQELRELAAKGVVPNDVNYPSDAPVSRHVYFNHLQARGDAPLGARVSPMEALLMYSHGANRKIYMDQLLANFTPDTFQRIRASQPWIAHDLGRWLLDVVGVPGPGTMYVQKKVESAGLWLQQFPMFQREGLAQEILDRYFLSPGGANNLSRVATGWAYTSKIGWNFLSSLTNLSQQIINGATEYGALNVLTSSLIGAGVAGGERIPVLAPIFDATVPKAAEYRKLLLDRGILSESSQRHFDNIALYEASFGTNRAHLAVSGGFLGAATGAAATTLLNTDRANGDEIPLYEGAAVGAGIASFGAAKSAIMRRALMRVRDLSTFTFNLAETWNRATVGIAGVREARSAMRAAESPAYATTRRAQEVIEGVFTGALGGAAVGNYAGIGPVAGAAAGAAIAGAAAPFGESRTARTQRTLAGIRATSAPIFEERIFRDQAKDALRPHTDDEVAALYAQMQTDITQFRIAKEGRGYFLNTPHGQALGALQSYTLNQAEFVGGRLQSFIQSLSATGPKQIDFRVFRHASYLLAVGSVYGALIGGASEAENDPDYWISRLGFGVMPLLRWNDQARHWEVMSPTDLFKGPLIGDITRVANAYLAMLTDDTASATLPEVTNKVVEQLFPGAKNIKRSAAQKNGASLLRYMQEGIGESMMGGPTQQQQPQRP